MIAWLLDRVFAIRPLLWIPAVAIYGAGLAWGSRERGRDDLSPGPLAALLLILAAVHAANAWRDREGDRLNRKRIPVGPGLVGGRSLLALSLGSVVVAALLARGATTLEQGLLLISFALGLAYVAPPLEFKRRPVLDVLSHGAGYGIVAFLLGAAPSSGPDGVGDLRPGLIAALPYALGIMTVSLLTMLADLEGDERVGQRTTAVALGSRRTAAASSALAWGTMGTGLLAGELMPTLWGALAAALLALGPEPESRTAGWWNTLSIRLQLLFLAILAPQAPAPLVVAILIGGAAETYNRWRWGVGYPLRAVSGESG
jgi:4-hydroxybenzoate polyprenyltransferase